MKIYLVFADGCDPREYGRQMYLVGAFSSLLEAETVMNLTKTQLKKDTDDIIYVKMITIDLDTYYPLIPETTAYRSTSFTEDFIYYKMITMLEVM